MENPAILLRRLNPYCARALEGAASLCQTRAHAEILPEHWLLKLLEQGEGDLTVLARRYEWDMDALWQALLSWLDNLPRSVRNRPQLSESIQSLMQAAWMRASLAGEQQIRSIHLLMALTEKPALARCDGLWPLLTLGQSQLERLRPLLDAQSDERPEVQQEAALTQTHGGDVEFIGRPAETAAAEIKPGELTPALQSALDKFTLDVTAKAREGRIDPVFGRDTEIRQMVDILSRRRKNNPILVGEPGVGKTALVEGLALRIAEGNVPASLRTVSLRTLDPGLLQAGAGVKGEFEQRLKNVIDAVQQSPEPVLLFIDEAHTIIGAGNQAGGADAANLLKPALARGELRTIAATTWSEYKQYFERDAALERRFQMVKVDEPDDDTACLMLRGLKSRYAEHHGVHITDEAVRAAVTLSRRYLTGRQLPDKAVDLLDTAGARVRMCLDTVPEVITRLKAQRTALELEKQALLVDAVAGGDDQTQRLNAIEQRLIDLDADIVSQEQRFAAEKVLAERLMACRQNPGTEGHADIHDLQQQLEKLQQGEALIQIDVDARTIAGVIADWTGVPLSSLMKDEQAELLNLDGEIGRRVVGQALALNAIAQRLRAAKTGLTSENGPQGVFLLTGPSGTGKTETALTLADVLYGGEKSLITINLSEYHEPHTVSQLKGSPPGYVGYGQGGILTEAVSGAFYARLRHERYLNGQTRLSAITSSAALSPGQVLMVTGGGAAVPEAFREGVLITAMTSHARRDCEFEVHFSGIPDSADVSFRPEPGRRPVMAGTLPARVTSTTENDPYGHIDKDGRYRVNMLFDRDSWETGFESLWVRQSRPYAGDTYGLHLPLLAGTEVAIGFEDGNPDRPYIAGVLHDSAHGDHVTIRNYKRNVLRTPANNKIRLDDERGKEHIKVSTEYGGKSQLNLGHLVDSEKQKRGEGFELRTDSWGAIRAQKGLFISADGQAGAQGEVLEMQPAISLLKGALNQVTGWGSITQTHHNFAPDVQPLQELVSGGSKLKEPTLLMSAPKGIAAVTPETALMHSGKGLYLQSLGEVNISTAQRYSVNASHAISMLAQQEGMRLVSAKGELAIESHADTLSLTSLKDVTIQSTQGHLQLTAKNGITIGCGGAYIRLTPAGEVEIHGPGVLSLKGKHDLQGPASEDFPLPELPASVCKDCLKKAQEEAMGVVLRG